MQFPYQNVYEHGIAQETEVLFSMDNRFNSDTANFDFHDLLIGNLLTIFLENLLHQP